jgi:hypothetical protein
MADDILDDENMFDELADAASLFEEIDTQPVRKDIGDILFVEGIEEDETVVDEDITTEDDIPGGFDDGTIAEAVGAADRVERAGLGTTRKRAPSRVVRRRAVSMEPAGSRNGTTIGELFVPLVRNFPASRIRVVENSIGSIFGTYLK